MFNKFDFLHGDTLKNVATRTGPRHKGYAVFLLSDDWQENMCKGQVIEEDFSVSQILLKHPELAGCVVKGTNLFYGQIVLRVAKPTEG